MPLFEVLRNKSLDERSVRQKENDSLAHKHNIIMPENVEVLSSGKRNNKKQA